MIRIVPLSILLILLLSSVYASDKIKSDSDDTGINDNLVVNTYGSYMLPHSLSSNNYKRKNKPMRVLSSLSFVETGRNLKRKSINGGNKSEEKCSDEICQSGVFKWHKSKKKNLYVGGIFPMVGGWPGGQACLPSAIMALNEVNTKASILPNYRLNLNWFNSECNPGKGVSNLYEMIFNKKKNQDDIIMLLGPGCSDVSSSVAEVANHWNLTVLSFGSSSPALSNRKRFRTFFRTHPSAILDNPARLSLCNKYKWKKIAALQDNKEVFTSTVDDLEHEAKQFNITIIDRQTFTDDPTYAIKNLKKNDVRIIVGVFYEAEAKKVFCQAYKEGMLFPKYIWMIIGWYSNNWWHLKEDEHEIGCNQTEMDIAVYGHLTTEVQFFNTEVETMLDYGKSVNEYDREFRRFITSDIWHTFADSFEKVDYKFKSQQTAMTNNTTRDHDEDIKSLIDIYNKIESEHSEHIEDLGGHLERALAYDAVWVMAYSLDKTLQNFGSLDHFNLSNYMISNYIKETIRATNFNGISGQVTFNDQGDRISEILYEQLQNVSGQLKYVKLGTHFRDRFDCCRKINWGASRDPPKDGVQKFRKITKISSNHVKLVFILSLTSMLTGFTCLLFNFIFRHRKIIKYSEPQINNTLIMGCSLCLLSLFIFGFDKSILSATFFNVLCQTEISILSIGFTIGYGSLFSKIWFVYTAQIEKKKHGLKVTVIPNKIKLYSIIAAMVAVDLVILLIWTLKDPLRKETLKLANEIVEGQDIIYEPEIEICKCQYQMIWIGVCFGIKGIVLILGLYLSYETRNSKIDRMNDSRFVALSIYNIAVLTLITAPVTIIIQHQLDAAFLFLALSINICSLLTFALLFFSKVKHVLKHTAEQDAYDKDAEDNALKQKKENYFNLLKENDELKDLVSKRQELVSRLEKLMNNGTSNTSSTVVQRRTTNGGVDSVRFRASNNNNNNENAEVVAIINGSGTGGGETTTNTNTNSSPTTMLTSAVGGGITSANKILVSCLNVEESSSMFSSNLTHSNANLDIQSESSCLVNSSHVNRKFNETEF